MNHPLFSLLTDLEAASIHFTLGRYRPDAICVALTLVGRRVEIDVCDDGHMEICQFSGDEGPSGDETLVRQLIAENRP